jgi:phosphoglycolate phosphatase
MVRIVLWDIDHTLIATRGINDELFAKAFREVTGCEIKRRPVTDGKTAAVAFREAAKLYELPAGREDFERFAVVLAEQHLLRGPAIRERGHVLPGAAAGLSGVASLPGVKQAVVTGNVRGAAEVKLRVMGLDSKVDWSIGAYGEDDDETADLIRTALGRAAEACGSELPPEEAVFIGDSPSDVEAGIASGVRVIAVASGRSNESELRAAGAELVLPGLGDTEELLKLLVAPPEAAAPEPRSGRSFLHPVSRAGRRRSA